MLLSKQSLPDDGLSVFKECPSCFYHTISPDNQESVIITINYVDEDASMNTAEGLPIVYAYEFIDTFSHDQYSHRESTLFKKEMISS